MFTSRVEYRLLVREDNADQRLSGYGHKFGLLTNEEYDQVKHKHQRIDLEIQQLRETRIHPGSEVGVKLNAMLQNQNSSPIRQVTALSEILKRPEMTCDCLVPFNGQLKGLSPRIIEQIEYEIKYEGFILRQRKDVERFRHIENIRIPDGMVFQGIPGLSKEIQQKLKVFTPRTLGQALRISGVTPAAISILMVYLRKLSLQRRSENEKQGGA